jgi:hypothetical protein
MPKLPYASTTFAVLDGNIGKLDFLAEGSDSVARFTISGGRWDKELAKYIIDTSTGKIKSEKSHSNNWPYTSATGTFVIGVSTGIFMPPSSPTATDVDIFADNTWQANTGSVPPA